MVVSSYYSAHGYFPYYLCNNFEVIIIIIISRGQSLCQKLFFPPFIATITADYYIIFKIPSIFIIIIGGVTSNFIIIEPALIVTY